VRPAERGGAAYNIVAAPRLAAFLEGHRCDHQRGGGVAHHQPNIELTTSPTSSTADR
jgi:hypothetical protein